MARSNGPRVLILDIETAPMLGYVWSLWDQNVGLNMIKADWYIISWAAKWRGEKEIMYMDQRDARNMENDRKILQGIWKLLNEADVVITQNGIKFDIKKLRARFILQGMSPPAPFKNIDTLRIAKSTFGFTSNKLGYLTEKLCTRYRKQKHKKYAGFEMWSECLRGNKDAWKHMEKYNKYDVLALEELYDVMEPWDGQLDFNLYHDDEVPRCRCGSEDFHRRGFAYTGAGKWQRYCCVECGAWTRDKVNLLSKEKRRSLRPTARNG